MKKYSILGALFGLLTVPLHVFGLSSQTLERLAPPFTFVPRFVVANVIDTATSPGGLSMGLLLLACVIFWALIGAGAWKIRQMYGKWVMVIALIALYVVLVMLNANFRP